VRHHLSQLGEKTGYFGRVIESGAHQASLKMVLDREIDASAIDSTVLEAELRRIPALETEIRIVKTIGPSPMPPWVVHKSVPAELRGAIANVLLEMHGDPDGHGILEQWGVSHFTAAEHSSYQSIQAMARGAEDVKLSNWDLSNSGRACITRHLTAAAGGVENHAVMPYVRERSSR
jgi:ABC-type phosphate/phosphonate transport system substrate-binding protein